MHPLAQSLAQTFVRDFWSADHSIAWTHAEEERSLWLTPNTLLLGRVDARGLNADGLPFFGEWKTLGHYRGRYIDDEKFKWRTDPQALTYGVLVPETHLFTVRWAIKPDDKGKRPPTTDFEWYTYTDQEVQHWAAQLVQIADEIRRNRERDSSIPWRTNFSHCFRYGRKYACPFFDKCAVQDWTGSMGQPRTPHLASENKLRGELDKYPQDLVVLDASRVQDYLGCPESYRRFWEGEGFHEESEALTIGTDFHSLIDTYIKTLVWADRPTTTGTPTVAMESLRS